MSESPQVTVCVPHWQALTLIRPCLRALRKRTRPGLAHVIVVDNGSRDESLDYLRALDWIELVERPEEGPEGWPENAFSAWDAGLARAQTPYVLTLHSDVFVLDEGWLDPLLVALEDPTVAGAGPWKQEQGGALYRLQRRLVAGALDRLRGRQLADGERYPRDYCALYRTQVLRERGLTFRPIHGKGGGYAIARQLWDEGHATRVVDLQGLVQHVGHGVAFTDPERFPPRERERARRRWGKVARARWFQDLLAADELDR
ncbi:MAG: glycosyltransferase family 2 protein [Planctomycetes bacterium]|nr:glycosyltransferase family 2 protein [Planctomycetota bacterium]